jgi:hypothetical protein
MSKTFFTKYHIFWIFFVLILLLAGFVRFYDYSSRYGLAYDQAHDALVARYAVEEGKLPLLGPFSSAGPFQTAGAWYWFIMIPTSIFPDFALSPWFFMTFIHILFVACIMILGKSLKGSIFSLVVGGFVAVSSAQIAQSMNLTNQSPNALLALFAIWSMYEYIKNKKIKYLFLLSFFISLSISIHLQGVALLVFLITVIIFTGIPGKKGIFYILIGLLIPMLPILIYDIQHNFFNIRNVIQYYLFDQYKISFEVLGRRWLTYIGDFLPASWSYVVGGVKGSGYVQIIGISVLFSYSFFKKNILKEWMLIGISAAGMIGLLRYTRTPLFDSYLVFLHPFIFLLVSYLVIVIYNKYKFLGILLFVFLFLGSFSRTIGDINGAYNYSEVISKQLIGELVSSYPREKFAVYDLNFQVKDKSLPLVLFLDEKNKIDNNGMRIGMSVDVVEYPVIAGKKGEYALYDLSATSSAHLKETKWAFVNPSEIYKSTEDWYENK